MEVKRFYARELDWELENWTGGRFAWVEDREQALVIAGFPGIGKTYAAKELLREGVIALDLESSDYKWLTRATMDVEGGKGLHTRENPDFIHDYISELVYQLDHSDVIFISTHKEVLGAVAAAGVSFHIAMPGNGMKGTMLGRYEERGNPKEFIDMMNRRYFDFWYDLLENTDATSHIFVSEGEYLLDRLV